MPWKIPPDAIKMCEEIDKRLRALQLKIEAAAETEEPFRLIDGIRINSFEILLTMDLKQQTDHWAVVDTVVNITALHMPV